MRKNVMKWNEEFDFLTFFLLGINFCYYQKNVIRKLFLGILKRHFFSQQNDGEQTHRHNSCHLQKIIIKLGIWKIRYAKIKIFNLFHSNFNL